MFTSPFANGIYQWLAEDNDDDDVTTAKGLLGLLGYGRKTAQGPSCLATSDFFDDIRDFQKKNGLKVDGVITPQGETARTIDRLLSEEIEKWQDVDESWGDSELEKKCAFNLLKVDLPTCDGVYRVRLGRARRLNSRAAKHAEREATRSWNACQSEARQRYAQCLRNDPNQDPSPLLWEH